MGRTRQVAARIAALVVAAWTLSACADASPGSTASVATRGAATGGAVSTTTDSGSFTGSNGAVTYEPADAPSEAASPDPNFDYGFVVQITTEGFHPKSLVSGCCKAVTWRNLTDKPQSVVFDHQFVDSGPIAPGATFVFTPDAPRSITYHNGLDPSMTGALQVQQEFDS